MGKSHFKGRKVFVSDLCDCTVLSLVELNLPPLQDPSSHCIQYTLCSMHCVHHVQCRSVLFNLASPTGWLQVQLDSKARERDTAGVFRILGIIVKKMEKYLVRPGDGISIYFKPFSK